MSAASAPIDAGLQARLRRAEAALAWTELPSPVPGVRARSARLRDEVARVEEVRRPGEHEIVVDSGPVGALVLLLASLEEGMPRELRALSSERSTRFPGGALAARWDPGALEPGTMLLWHDLVALVRYAMR